MPALAELPHRPCLPSSWHLFGKGTPTSGQQTTEKGKGASMLNDRSTASHQMALAQVQHVDTLEMKKKIARMSLMWYLYSRNGKLLNDFGHPLLPPLVDIPLVKSETGRGFQQQSGAKQLWPPSQH